MAYDENLVPRIEGALTALGAAFKTKKMFGGLTFMVNGHMTCGIVKSDLMLRVGAEACDALLEEDHARPMDFTGKPLRGFVYVEPEGFEEDEHLVAWVERSLDFVLSQPPKPGY